MISPISLHPPVLHEIPQDCWLVFGQWTFVCFPLKNPIPLLSTVSVGYRKISRNHLHSICLRITKIVNIKDVGYWNIILSTEPLADNQFPDVFYLLSAFSRYKGTVLTRRGSRLERLLIHVTIFEVVFVHLG